MEEIECKWCGDMTIYLTTQECNRCWELRHRIESDLDTAEKMIEVIQKGEE